MRNKYLARFINKVSRLYWFITRPSTKGVKALIFHENEILMVRLSYYPNTWTFPGGGVGKNEDPTTAIIRECFEEVGVKLKNPQLLKQLSFDHEYKKDKVFIFKEEIDDLNIKIDTKEVIEANWFSIDNLPTMGPNAKNIISLVFKNPLQ